MDKYAQFNRRLLIGFAAAMLLAVGINALVDPINMFGAIAVKGFNRDKTQVGDPTTRRWKAAEIARHPYEVFLLGSSRVLVGLDPARGFAGYHSVYNAGAGGANFYETYQVFEFIRRHQHPRAVVVGLDLFSFGDGIEVSGDYEQSLYSGQGKAAVYFKYLVSWETLMSSLRTVNDNLHGRPTLYTAQGFRDMDTQYRGQPFPHRRNTEFTLNRSFRVKEWYGDYHYSAKRVELLSRMIDECRADGIELYLYLSPVHAIVLEAERTIGLEPDFERWKRELTALVAEKNRSGPRLTLWDFCGYNALSTEETPPAEDDPRLLVRMRCFWDGSHCTDWVGTMVLDIIAGRSQAQAGAPPDFGRELTPDTIEAALAEDRARQKDWERADLDDVKWVEDLAMRTRRFRPPGSVLVPLRMNDQGGKK